MQKQLKQLKKITARYKKAKRAVKKISLFCIILFIFTLPITAQVRSVLTDTSSATTAWDSVYVDAEYYRAYVQVINYDTLDLYLAIKNDTSSGKVITIPKNWYYNIPQALYGTRHVRTKSSGTCRRAVISIK